MTVSVLTTSPSPPPPPPPPPQVVLDISGTLSSNALFKTTRDALHGAITVVQQVGVAVMW